MLRIIFKLLLRVSFLSQSCKKEGAENAKGRKRKKRKIIELKRLKFIVLLHLTPGKLSCEKFLLNLFINFGCFAPQNFFFPSKINVIVWY